MSLPSESAVRVARNPSTRKPALGGALLASQGVGGSRGGLARTLANESQGWGAWTMLARLTYHPMAIRSLLLRCPGEKRAGVGFNQQ